MARRKRMHGRKRRKCKSPLKQEHNVNVESTMKPITSKPSSDKVEMDPRLQSYIDDLNKPKKKEESTSTEKKSKKSTTQQWFERQAKKYLKPSVSKVIGGVGKVVKPLSKLQKMGNVAALMLDSLPAGEGSTIYTYKVNPKTGLSEAYWNHGPNKGKKVEYEFDSNTDTYSEKK